MTKEELRAYRAFLIEMKRELKGEERKGYALAIEESCEWLEEKYGL
jgi:hypothetical protein